MRVRIQCLSPHEHVIELLHQSVCSQREQLDMRGESVAAKPEAINIVTHRCKKRFTFFILVTFLRF